MGLMDSWTERVINLAADVVRDHEAIRLGVLNWMLDGKVKRWLEGERQKLDPWGQWMHSTYLDASTGHPEWRESAETRTILPNRDGANLICSELPNGKHIPMFDIDFPMRVVPSTNPGKGHLYIDKPISWPAMVDILYALKDAGIVHRNYVEHSEERGNTTLRPAFVRKPNKGWSSDSDEMPFPDGALDDALVPDYAKIHPEHDISGGPCWCGARAEYYDPGTL